MMTSVLAGLGLLLVMPLAAARALFLAPTRLGWATLYANTVSDYAIKRMPIARGVFETTLFISGLALLAIAGRPTMMIGAALLVLVLLLDLANRRHEAHVLSTAYIFTDSRRRSVVGAHQIGSLPRPSPHPHLVVNLRGPFHRRHPRYELGTLPVGRPVTVRVLVANHSIVPCQVAPVLEAAGPPAIRLELEGADVPLLAIGGVHECTIRIIAERPVSGASFRIILKHAALTTEVSVFVRAATEKTAPIRRASISRYPGAARAAFVWRGDIDHYDTSTFQSIAGIEAALELGRRYRFPQTLYLSSRLCLVPTEAESFYGHFGVERETGRDPALHRMDTDRCGARSQDVVSHTLA